MKNRMFAAVFGAALVFAACGNDDGGSAGISAELQPYADALAASLESDDDGVGITTAEYQCIAEQSVAVFGLERLEAVGTPDEVIAATEDDLTALDVTDAEADQVVDAYFDCADGFGDKFRDALVEDAPSEEAADCAKDILDDDAIRTFFSASIAGDEDAAFGLFEQLSACE